jgi:hypothetical protein
MKMKWNDDDAKLFRKQIEKIKSCYWSKGEEAARASFAKYSKQPGFVEFWEFERDLSDMILALLEKKGIEDPKVKVGDVLTNSDWKQVKAYATNCAQMREQERKQNATTTTTVQ